MPSPPLESREGKGLLLLLTLTHPYLPPYLTSLPTLPAVVLIKWCPDTVSFRLKPVIGASYQTLKEKLQGLGKDIQAADTSDLDYEAIKKVLC